MKTKTQTQCSFCGCETAHPHAHHFPVLKSEGGERTIKICPKCHRSYHSGCGHFKAWGRKGGKKTAKNPTNWQKNLKQYRKV